MKALVTGAGGFLGGHVVGRLAELGHAVFTLGRSRPAGVPAGCAFPLADPGDAAAIEAALQKVEPDLVFHLAGTTSGGSLEQAYRVNALFGAYLLRAARQLPAPPRILLAGSAAEYGPIAEAALPVAEDAPCRPVSVYGITKLAQTLHGLAGAAEQPVVVARLFNIVGSGMSPHLALGSFAAQIRAMPAIGGILRTGPLARERDFVEAGPTAAVLIDLLCDPRATGKVFNVCSGLPSSLAAFTAALVAAAGRPVQVHQVIGSAGNSDMIRHWGSAGRLEALGYHLPAPDPERVARALLGA